MDPTALEPLGDRAYLAHFADERAAAGWAAAVRDRRWPGVTDVVLAYRTVAVFADPDRVDLSELESRLRDHRDRPGRIVGTRIVRRGEAAGDPGPVRRGGPGGCGRAAGSGPRPR